MARELDSPLHHFELHTLVPLNLFGVDISINKAVILMWIVCGSLMALFYLASKGRRIIPTRIQSVIEMLVEFIRDMVLDTMGEKGLKLLPFLITLFFFILLSNLLGLIPGSYTVTSQVAVTGLFAITVYLISIVMGLYYHGLHYFSIFSPPGTPRWLVPAMIPIEIISQLARPFTLALRLFINMTVGHMMIAVFLGLAMWSMYALVPLVGLSVALYGLEVFISCIQAYIFTILACVYIGEAIRLH